MRPSVCIQGLAVFVFFIPFLLGVSPELAACAVTFATGLMGTGAGMDLADLHTRVKRKVD